MNIGEERRTLYIEPIEATPGDEPSFPIEPVPEPKKDTELEPA